MSKWNIELVYCLYSYCLRNILRRSVPHNYLVSLIHSLIIFCISKQRKSVESRAQRQLVKNGARLYYRGLWIAIDKAFNAPSLKKGFRGKIIKKYSESQSHLSTSSHCMQRLHHSRSGRLFIHSSFTTHTTLITH